MPNTDVWAVSPTPFQTVRDGEYTGKHARVWWVVNSNAYDFIELDDEGYWVVLDYRGTDRTAARAQYGPFRTFKQAEATFCLVGGGTCGNT